MRIMGNRYHHHHHNCCGGGGNGVDGDGCGRDGAYSDSYRDSLSDGY